MLRLVLTAFFVLNPLILYFGGNGMSEALYLFCMLAAARYMSRWLAKGDLPSLVYSATALGFGYLERTEPIAAAVCTVPLVLLVTFSRTDGDYRRRLWTGMTDVAVFTLPIFTSFIGWAAVSWVITGQPFQQITSKYGNATLLANSHQVTSTLHDRLVHEAKAITYVSPFLLVIVIAAIAVAVIRRNIGAAGFILILGGGLGFTLASFLANAIFVVPLLHTHRSDGGTASGKSVRHSGEVEAPVEVAPPSKAWKGAFGSLAASFIVIALLIPVAPEHRSRNDQSGDRS